MSLKVDIWMPLYVQEYITDTLHLSAQESGAYLFLLMFYWKQGRPLPAEDELLARLARVNAAEWPRVRQALAPFFEVTASHWRHARLEYELALAAKARLNRSQGAHKTNQQLRRTIPPAETTAAEPARDSSPSDTPTDPLSDTLTDPLSDTLGGTLTDPPIPVPIPLPEPVPPPPSLPDGGTGGGRGEGMEQQLLKGREPVAAPRGGGSAARPLSALLEKAVGDLLPTGFPRSDAEALAHGAIAGCPEEFTRKVYQKADGRGGRDARDVPIRNFRAYLKTEWTYEQERRAQPRSGTDPTRPSGHAPPQRDALTANARDSTALAQQLKGYGKLSGR